MGANLPSLALAQLAAVARQAGCEVLLRDASAGGASLKATVDEIAAFRPGLLGLTATTMAVTSAAAVAAGVRAALPDCLCVLGGPHASAVPRSTLEAHSAFDAAVVGEGEETLLELLARLPGRDFSGVRGLVWREGDQLRCEEPRPRLADLNLLPLPWWEGYPGYPGAYHAAAVKTRRPPAAYFVTSRGCPYHCTFCDRSVFGQAVTAYSAEYVLRAVDDMVRRFGIREISFEDDMFTIYRPRLTAICEELVRRRYDLIWSCNARADSVTEELLRLMKRAGCWQVSLGVESADKRVLELARKRVQPERIATAVQAAHRVGMEVKGFFILGLPGENDETIEESIRFALGLPFDDVTVTFFTPFPGSEISSRAEEWGRPVAGADKMNLTTPAYLPHGMTAERLQERHREFYRRFYLRPRYLLRIFGRLLRQPGPTMRILWAGRYALGGGRRAK